MYKAILFDLDGTLTESGPGIMRSVQYALLRIGHPEENIENLRVFVGPPLKEQFMKYAGIDEETADAALTFYRQRYAPIGMYENELYPGVVQMLEDLHTDGYTLAVASSKPEPYVLRILEHFDIAGYFEVVVGSGLDGSLGTKEEVVREALIRLGLEEHPEETLMVGDKEHDVFGARAAGVECIGAAWGYGAPGELEKAEPLKIVRTPEDVVQFLNSTPLRRESVLRKIWRTLYPAGIHLGISIAVSSVFGMLAAAFVGLEMANDLSYRYTIELTGITAMLTILPCAFLYLNDRDRRKDGRLIPSPPGGKISVPGILLLVGLGAALSLYGNVLLGLLAQLFPIDDYSEVIEQVERGKTLWVLIICMGILAPIAEEMVFRWLIYLRLRDTFPIWIAALISSAFFGIYHGNVMQAIYAGVLGLFFALALEMTGNIWSSVILHVSANIFSLAMQEFAALEEYLGESDAELLIGLFAIALLAFLVVVPFWLRKVGRKRGAK
ncbi:MAG: HAD hydrolase-like protein [Blautia sp.]|nr:HAD hydrolase-like protein [Blautia sp.]